MMKKILVFSLLAVISLIAKAQPISQEQAKNRAFSYLKQSSAASGPRHAMSRKAQWKEARLDVQHIYAFNLDGGGFVIASGDERALPVLGYSDSGTIDADNMPENMRWWLKGYEEAIAELGNAVIINPLNQNEQRAAIAPLVKTTWDQLPVYNQDCPVYNGAVEKYKGKQCLTGCVATAMAMVMYYHRYPAATTSPIPAYDYVVTNLANGVVEDFHSDALPEVTFDWNNMLEKYCVTDANGNDAPLPGLTDQQKKAVSTLMRYCGQATKMSYSPHISTTHGEYIAQALFHYFNYDKGVECVYRPNYSISEWETLCYNELAANRPVVLAGSANDGGHAFVCDGYDGNGLFHINWGWGGYCDNYFALSVLNPYSFSNQTNAIGTGYCMNQRMIVGIQPPTEGTTTANDLPKLIPNSNFIIHSTDADSYFVTTKIAYRNMIYPEAYFECDMFHKNEKGNMERATHAGVTPFKVESGNNYDFTVSIAKKITIPDCELTLYLLARCTNVEGSEWQYVCPRMSVICTIKNGEVSLQLQPTPQLSITACNVSRGNYKAMKANNISLTIQNKGNEYQGQLDLMPYYIGEDEMETAYSNIINSKPEANNYEREPNVSSAGYFRTGESANVNFNFTPKKVGRYLFFLTERYNNAMLGYFAIYFTGETNAIRTVSIQQATDAPTFDLQGRRVGHQPHGIVIQNGKKFLRK